MRVESINNIPKAHPVGQQRDRQPQNEQTNSTIVEKVTKDSKYKTNIKLDKSEELINNHKLEVVNSLNNIISSVDKRLEFIIHEATNRTTYKIINKETNEVLKEFPPEQILDLVAKLMEMAGIFIDEKA